VGGKAQLAAYRAIAGSLKLAYSQFEELESFSRFGTRVDDNTRKVLDHGERIRACLKQSEFSPLSVTEQIGLFVALTGGLFDAVPLDQMPSAQKAVCDATARLPEELTKRLLAGDKLSDPDRASVLESARVALQPKP
jgi:F-type H+-transporting ATPase subunit alpha